MRQIVYVSLAIGGLFFVQPTFATVVSVPIKNANGTVISTAWGQDGTGNFFSIGGLYGINGDNQADVNPDGGLDVHITNSVTVSNPVNTVTVANPVNTVTVANPTTTVTVANPVNTVTVSNPVNTVTVANPVNTVTVSNPVNTVATSNPTVGCAITPVTPCVGAFSSNALTGIIQADASAPINVSSTTAVQLVAAGASSGIWVTSWHVTAGGSGTFTLEYGTQTTNPCDTGATALTGAEPLIAQSQTGEAPGRVIYHIPSGKQLCALVSTTAQMSGSISYTKW